VSKVELFEVIRREHFIQGKGIRRIAREQGVHRRLVRQAIGNALPPARKVAEREGPVLTKAWQGVIDGWLRGDREAPRKQHHTGRRIFQRLQGEYGYPGAESTGRRYIGRRRRELSLGNNAFVPQIHCPGEEGEVDWYEAVGVFPWGEERVQFFQMRACFSGREFHLAFPRQTQQAFLEGHVAAFAYFGGVFRRVRYDNLGSAVKRVLRGRRREETDRFVALRSHYLFAAEFCQPGVAGAHEKGGVESGVGRFRRTHLVPVPHFDNYEALNRYLRAHCQADDSRRLAGRGQTVAEDWEVEGRQLLPLPEEPFPTAEISTVWVNAKGLVSSHTNRYSVPIRLVGRRVEVRVHARFTEVVHGGQIVAVHERLQGQQGIRVQLDHYLELLREKPGALKGSLALHQAREAGGWPGEYDRLWAILLERYGEADGTRALVEVLMLHRQAPAEVVHQAITQALRYGCCDAHAIGVLVRCLQEGGLSPPPLTDLGALSRYARPAGGLQHYEVLLSGRMQ
jgi:transposase